MSRTRAAEMAVEVRPQSFEIVFFDNARITELATGVADALGLAGDRIEIEIDENSALNQISLTSLDPVVLVVDSGALEDPARLRRFSDERTVEELTRVLQRVVDRRDQSFDGAPAEEELSHEQLAAWDASALGRACRRGVKVHKPRRRYQFLVRHGFTDAAEAAFERLWSNDTPSWADVEAACADTAAGRPEPATGQKRAERSKA